MSRDFRSAWAIALVGVGLAVAVLLLRTSEELKPELVAAYVAIQPQGKDVARVGEVRISAGTGFQLHAVVEALDWRGRKVFFTEAENLEIQGDRVEPEMLRPWDRARRARVMWFTIEGSPPYVDVVSPQDAERLRYRDVFQADWPQAWSVPGRLDPAVENFLPDQEVRSVTARFGTQRFHVRVEVFKSSEDLLPAERLSSAGAADLEESPVVIPTVVAELEWPLRSISGVFGLPQVEGDAALGVESLERRLANGLAFNRVQVLRSWLDEAGVRWEDLEWTAAELDGGREWVRGAAIRAGSKVAFSFRDAGVEGRLDREDLSLDFDRGATVRTLEEIFVGEGLVEIARVADLEIKR